MFSSRTTMVIKSIVLAITLLLGWIFYSNQPVVSPIGGPSPITALRVNSRPAPAPTPSIWDSITNAVNNNAPRAIGILQNTEREIRANQNNDAFVSPFQLVTGLLRGEIDSFSLRIPPPIGRIGIIFEVHPPAPTPGPTPTPRPTPVPAPRSYLIRH